MATAISSTRIRWVVNPTSHGGLVSIAQKQLRSTLLHELHHEARGAAVEGEAPRATLMDAVVNEGLATASARDAALRRPPWSEYHLKYPSGSRNYFEHQTAGLLKRESRAASRDNLGGSPLPHGPTPRGARISPGRPPESG